MLTCPFHRGVPCSYTQDDILGDAPLEEGYVFVPTTEGAAPLHYPVTAADLGSSSNNNSSSNSCGIGIVGGMAASDGLLLSSSPSADL